jgi:hypothetical protein
VTELPRRSLLAAVPLEAEHNDEARIWLLCDCGMSTDLRVGISGLPPSGAEAAFTCDGCETSHWFTLTFE